MAYIAQNDIVSLALGKSWRKGQSIGDEAIPMPWRQTLIDDGAIKKLESAPEPKPKAPKRKAVSDEQGTA